MARRRKIPDVNPCPHIPPVLDWTVTEHWSWHGRHVDPGTELSIRAEHGRFIFVKHVARPNGIEWIDTVAIDHKGNSTGWRSFRPGRIRTVHRLTKARSAAAAQAA